MKNKNAILIGFVSSALDYLKSMDDEVGSDFKSKDLDKIRGDLTDRLNSLLYCVDADSSDLIDAGREAFGDFVVEKKKGLIDEFADLFSEANSENKQKDITERLEKLLNEPEEETVDLTYLFPDFADEPSSISNIFETGASEETEIDSIFSEIVAHEKGIPSIAEELERDLVNDSLVYEILADEDIMAKDPEIIQIERPALYQLPIVRKDDRSFEELYSNIAELSLNLADIIDNLRGILGIPEPKMWVEPIRCQKFIVPTIKRAQVTDENLQKIINDTVDIFSAIIDDERIIQGIPEPKIVLAKTVLILPTVRKDDRSFEELYSLVDELAFELARTVDEERLVLNIPQPQMWQEPQKEILTYTYIVNPGLDYLEEQPETEVDIPAFVEEIDEVLEEYLRLEEKLTEELRKEALRKVDPDIYIDNLINEVKTSAAHFDQSQNVFDSLKEMFPYLNEAFIRSVYDLKSAIANEYPFNKRMILLHRLIFTDVDKLRSFVEIMLDHAYQVNVDEKQMIVDVFKEMVNSDGLILSNIFEIANQAAFLDGEYEGYRIIALD